MNDTGGKRGGTAKHRWRDTLALHRWYRLSMTLTIGAGLSACAETLRLQPVSADLLLPQRRGFVVRPPQGPDWYFAPNERRGLVFRKTKPEAPADTAAHDFTLGVFPLAGVAATTDASVDAFPAAAERFLYHYLTRQRQNQVVQFAAHRADLNGALCIRYQALLIGRYRFYNERRSVPPRLQFADTGYLCRHPRDDKLLVHAFYSKTSYYLRPEVGSNAVVEQAEGVLRSLQFTSHGNDVRNGHD